MSYYNNRLSDNMCSTITSSSDIYYVDGNNSINTFKDTTMRCLIDNAIKMDTHKAHKLVPEDPAVIVILRTDLDMNTGVNYMKIMTLDTCS